MFFSYCMDMWQRLYSGIDFFILEKCLRGDMLETREYLMDNRHLCTAELNRIVKEAGPIGSAFSIKVVR